MIYNTYINSMQCLKQGEKYSSNLTILHEDDNYTYIDNTLNKRCLQRHMWCLFKIYVCWPQGVQLVHVNSQSTFVIYIPRIYIIL